MVKVASGVSGNKMDDMVSNNSYMTKGGDNDAFADM